MRSGEYDPILDDEDDVDPDDEQVDVHSVLSIATHTLDDIGEDIVQAPTPHAVGTGAPKSNIPPVDVAESEEKETIAFPMPAGLMVSQNVNTDTAPLIAKKTVSEAIETQSEDVSEWANRQWFPWEASTSTAMRMIRSTMMRRA